MSRIVEHTPRGLCIRFPFDRRLVDLVKSLPDRRWNPQEKVWTVPEDAVVEVVDSLHAEGFAFDDEVKRLYAGLGGTRPLGDPPPTRDRGPGLFDSWGSDPEPAPSDDDYTVGRLNREVKAVLDAAFPAPIWLVGEISGFNKSAHKKHVGFSLVELSPAGERLAEVGAILFGDVRRNLEAKLSAAGDPFRLEDEIRVRLQVRVDLYDAWGQYRVRIEDLDVAYTLGEAARRREEIVRRLGEEGLLERNSTLPLPDLPLRLGLITSLGSDAMNDVLKTLRESGFAFDVTVHGARVQGKATEPSVLNALDRLRGGKEPLDAILICRGGGSRSDLGWFDTEALGRAVALFPIPVIVGIGHEQDVSVLDHVARRAKTPTAAAQQIVQRVREALDRVEETGRAILEGAAAILEDESRSRADRARRLVRAVRGRLELERSESRRRRERIVHAAGATLVAARREATLRALEIPRSAERRLDAASVGLRHASRQLAQGARRDLAASGKKADETAAVLAPRARRLLALAVERIDARSRRLGLVDPARVVERGYAIVRGPSGRVVADPAAAPRGSALRLSLRGGDLRARSEGPDSTSTEENEP